MECASSICGISLSDAMYAAKLMPYLIVFGCPVSRLKYEEFIEDCAQLSDYNMSCEVGTSKNS